MDASGNSESTPVSGPVLTIPDLNVGLGTRFYNSLEKYKDKVHQVDSTSSTSETKQSVKMRAIKVAIELRKQGIGPKNVVVISSKSHMDLSVSVLACLFIGAIVAPLNSDHPYEEMKTFIRILKPKCAFCGNRSARLMLRILQEESITCPIYEYEGDSRDFVSFEKCMENELNPNFSVVTIQDPKKQIAFISYTQGTEGDPKMVSISHHAMAMRYIPILQWAFKRNEKVLSTFPLSNCVQLVVMCICFDSAARLVILRGFTERGFCKIINDMKIEVIFIDAKLAVMICKNAPVQDFDLTSVKMMFLTNSISTANYIKVVRTFKKTIIATDYSTVECGAVAFATQEMYLRNRDKLNSIGQLCAGVSVKIAPPQNGVCPVGWGELHIKTPSLMSGYYSNHIQMKNMNRGYFRTGDLAKIEDDGFLFIRGRVCDEIQRGNHVFSTQEIDNALQAHPDVLEAASFVNEFDELVAHVVKKPGKDSNQRILTRVLAELLPKYKVPTKIIFTDSLPKTPLGTVKKYQLKAGIKLIREESFYHADIDD